MWTVLTYAWCTQSSHNTHLKHNAFTQVKPDDPLPPRAPQLPVFSLQRKSALCRFVRMRSSLSMCKIALRRFAQECMSTVCANDLCRNMCNAHCALDNTYNYLQFKISRFCSIGSRWSCSTARLVWLFNFCFNFEQPTMPSEANCFLITPSFTYIEIPPSIVLGTTILQKYLILNQLKSKAQK